MPSGQTTHRESPLFNAQRIVAVLAVLTWTALATRTLAVELTDNNRAFRTIFNNDTDNVLYATDSGKSPQHVIADYRRAITQIAEARPGIMAQNVGNPDPVIYRSAEATAWSKYLDGPVSISMNKMIEAETDPLQVTVEVCHEHGVPVVASYRMNAEDFYEEGLEIQDFGRKHRHLAIPGAFCLDSAHPVVYQHRMAIFREVAEKYDIDGIEFDFRRWTHMISDPLHNHPILTRMVRETRAMLNEVAKKKGKKRMILGVRVGPSLDTPQDEAHYAGTGAGMRKVDPSCRELGLDVRTWVRDELVDYICPTLFWPDWPGLPWTHEFVELAKGHNIGIYPTIFPRPTWLNDSGVVPPRGPIEPNDTDKLQEYKDGFCNLALRCHSEGADGVSMFNWYFHLHLSRMPRQWQSYYGYGMGGAAIQKHMLSIMGDPQAVRDYQRQSWFWPAPWSPRLEDLPYVVPSITVRQTKHPSKELPSKRIPAQRIPVGIANDAQPTLGILPSGDLLLLLSHTYDDVPDGKLRDELFFCRSTDGGKRWTRPEPLPMIGRDPHLTVASNGTLFVTTRWMAEDTANITGQINSFLYGSVDGGKRWSAVRLSESNLPPKEGLRVSRNLMELADGSLVLGVSSNSGDNRLWRSRDGGLTWDKSQRSDFGSQPISFESAQLIRGDGAVIRCVARSGGPSDPRHPSLIPNPDLLMGWSVYRSVDEGKTWQRDTDVAAGLAGLPTVLVLNGSRWLWTVGTGKEILGVQNEGQSSDVLELVPAGSASPIDPRTCSVATRDGHVVTSYAYRDNSGIWRTMIVRWRLPETQ